MSGGRSEPIREYSYGGVAVRDGREVAVIVPRGTRALALPKGGADAGESGAQAAAREVREEAGVDVEVRERLGDVRYWYRRGGKRIYKTVGFFLCEVQGGDPKDHDHEVEEARFIPLDEALERLSYKGEREMVERAMARLSAGPGA